jgi:hypothetical protein
VSRRLIDFSRSFCAHTNTGAHRDFTVEDFFQETVWGSAAWSTDEATGASFRRIIKLYNLMKEDGRHVMAIEGADFDRLMGIIRAANFTGPNAIGLSELRIGIALSEIEETPKADRKTNNVEKEAEHS